jgi:hypothetical protein
MGDPKGIPWVLETRNPKLEADHKGPPKSPAARGKRPVADLIGIQKARQIWGCSSVGRAPALQAGGQEFESPHLHHNKNSELRTQNSES